MQSVWGIAYFLYRSSRTSRLISLLLHTFFVFFSQRGWRALFYTMKKTLLVLFCFLSSIPIFCQTIAWRDEKDGVLSIGTDYMMTNYGFLSRRINMGVSLSYSYNSHNDSELFTLGILLYTFNEKCSFDKGSKLKIETFDNQAIKLIQIDNDVHSVLESEYSTRDYLWKSDPSYSLTRDQLEMIIKGGVTRIWFQSTNGLFYKPFDKDLVGPLLDSEWKLIQQKMDVTKGF